MYGKAFLLLILPTITAQRCTDSTRTNFEWKFEFDQKTYYHGCDFLSNANQRTNAKRQMNWCNERVVNEKSNRNVRVLIKNMCREACNNCDEQNDPNCTDSPRNWRDSKGNACVWYEEGGNRRCNNFGSRWEYNGNVADEVCCACGGGRRGQNDGGCRDVSGWHERNDPQHDCDWYAEKAVQRCRNFGDSFPYRGLTANEACCACKNRNKRDDEYYDVVTSEA